MRKNKLKYTRKFKIVSIAGELYFALSDFVFFKPRFSSYRKIAN